MHYLNEPSWLTIFNRYGSNPYSVYPGIIQPVSECYFDLNYRSISGILKFYWENDPVGGDGVLVKPLTRIYFYYDRPVSTEIKIIPRNKQVKGLAPLTRRRTKLSAPLDEHYIATTNNKAVLQSIEHQLHFLDIYKEQQLVLETPAAEKGTEKSALLVQANSLIRHEEVLEKLFESMEALYKELKNN